MNRETKFRIWTGSMMEPWNHCRVWESLGFYLEGRDGYIPMQFTGAKDDNGQEIFEGDVCTLIDGSVVSVEWNDDILRWQFSDGKPLNDGENYSAFKVVIGNIYEDQYLLK